MSTSVTPRPATSATPWRVILSWLALLLTPVELVIGFVLGYGLGLDPSIENPLTGWDAAWRVVILWLVVVAGSVVGIALGVSARRHGERSAVGAVVVNALLFGFLTLITLGTGLWDAFS